MSHPHCHRPVWEVETLYSWGYYKYSQTQWTTGETNSSSYEHQMKPCTPANAMHSEQHEDDCLFCKMLFFSSKIYWLATVVPGECRQL